jgi:hypothetical protein
VRRVGQHSEHGGARSDHQRPAEDNLEEVAIWDPIAGVLVPIEEADPAMGEDCQMPTSVSRDLQ